jgi:thiamine phosphate synthase YjbQ (UPF0047 family)
MGETAEMSVENKRFVHLTLFDREVGKSVSELHITKAGPDHVSSIVLSGLNISELEPEQRHDLLNILRTLVTRWDAAKDTDNAGR